VPIGDPQPSAVPTQQERLSARVAAKTDVGKNRGNNEDSHLILPLDGSAPHGYEAVTLSIGESGLLLAVADGMGGHHAGEVASSKCVEYLAREIISSVKAVGGARSDMASLLERAVLATHQAVYDFAQEYSKLQSMGTTLTAVALRGVKADIAEVGDSRAYLFRDGNLILLTEDQTIGNELRNHGGDPSMMSQQMQEVLAQALGSRPEIRVVLTAVDLLPQDLLLVCCDGLYKVVPPDELVEILELNIPPTEKTARLIARANEHGGPDNITAIVAEISGAAAAG
jgi:PPM family protein phosphatase